METDWDAQGLSERFTELPRIWHGSALERFADEKTAQRIGLTTVFLIRKPFLCQSIADT